MSDIYREIEREWVTLYEKMPCETPSRGDFTDACAEAETETRGQTSDGLQPWLGILEFGIEWLAYIHVALGTEKTASTGRDLATA